jgi:hypothetical protein
MNRTSLSKSVRTIGLMAVLSVLVATTLQQPVQSQAIAKDNNGVCAPLPEGISYQEFEGIKFSPSQKLAYRKIEAKIQKRYKVISDNTREVVVPGGGLAIYFKEGIGDRKATEISDVSLKMSRDKLSTDKQIKLLTKKYGKYGIFSPTTSLVYTPEQIALGHKIGRDFEAQTMAILAPEQQKIYQVNLTLQRRIQACSLPPQPFDRILSPLPY